MKGIIFSAGLFLVILNLFLAIIWYTDYESARSTSSTALKRSLAYTVENGLLHNERGATALLTELNATLTPLLRPDLSYELQLVGYQASPLFFRIRLVGQKSQQLGYSFLLEETIIEQAK